MQLKFVKTLNGVSAGQEMIHLPGGLFLPYLTFLELIMNPTMSEFNAALAKMVHFDREKAPAALEMARQIQERQSHLAKENETLRGALKRKAKTPQKQDDKAEQVLKIVLDKLAKVIEATAVRARSFGQKNHAPARREKNSP